VRVVKDFWLVDFKKTVRAVKGFEFECGVVLWRNVIWRVWARSEVARKFRGVGRVSVGAMRGGD
jgi:hypothetical protein